MTLDTSSKWNPTGYIYEHGCANISLRSCFQFFGLHTQKYILHEYIPLILYGTDLVKMQSTAHSQIKNAAEVTDICSSFSACTFPCRSPQSLCCCFQGLHELQWHCWVGEGMGLESELKSSLWCLLAGWPWKDPQSQEVFSFLLRKWKESSWPR